MEKKTESKGKSVFTLKYYSNPEYRAKHIKNIMQKVICPGCGSTTMKCNMSHHKQTKKHQRIIKEKLDTENKLKNDWFTSLIQGGIAEKVLKEYMLEHKTMNGI